MWLLRTRLSALPDSAFGEAVCVALRGQVEKLGLSIGDEPVWAEAVFAEEVDHYSQEVSVIATWRGKQRYGTVTFFPDGRVFAEYQVLLAHPSREDCYVESVQVWGRPEKLSGLSSGVVAFTPLPALSALRDEDFSPTIQFHPTAVVREAEIHLGLPEGAVEPVADFQAWVDTPDGDAPILLAAFAGIDPPFEAADRVRGRFIAITESR